MKIVPEEFGKLVFNENAMRKALSKEVFDKLEQTIKNGESLDSSLAHKVAEAMKDWAIANGATIILTGSNHSQVSPLKNMKVS